MDAIRDILCGLQQVGGEQLRVAEPQSQPWAAIDPGHLRVEVASAARLQLIVLHTSATTSKLDIELHEGAQLELTEIFAAETFAEVHLRQAAQSTCRVIVVQLAGANAAYEMNLDGRGAENTLGGVFLVGGAEHSALTLHTNHLVSDCRSASVVKGIAGGVAVGEFHGLVYVATDAQRTDAQQQSRNILLSDAARIVTKPQLEIYADDVKCTHGATVGQMDSEAILYMRQRGLSAMQARQLQIEGFVGDIVRRCGLDELCEPLMEAVAAKMEKMQ